MISLISKQVIQCLLYLEEFRMRAQVPQTQGMGSIILQSIIVNFDAPYWLIAS